MTICVNGKECLFGEIKKGEIFMNDAGLMIKTWFVKIKQNFKNAKIGGRFIVNYGKEIIMSVLFETKKI
ncbi:MAG: hypothetical protein AB1498_05355 [bacterium]